jgi:hypothetical protein
MYHIDNHDYIESYTKRRFHLPGRKAGSILNSVSFGKFHISRLILFPLSSARPDKVEECRIERIRIV